MTNNTIQIVPLSRDEKDVLRFLKVSYDIYRNDPYWVAPLLVDLKKVFTDKNPLFEHAEMAQWVATHNGQDVGRIAAIFDRDADFDTPAVPARIPPDEPETLDVCWLLDFRPGP